MSADRRAQAVTGDWLVMVENGREPEAADRAFWSWLGFWVQFLVLGICIVLGAFAASGAEEPGDYAAGIVLIICALALALLRLKQSFDGWPSGLSNFLLVDNFAGLAVVIPLFAVIGIAGLFLAQAWLYGSLHDAGIALFVFSGVIVFLDIKQVFDRMGSD
jgi:hypothetical protein